MKEIKEHVELINDNIEEFDKSIELFKQETTLEEAAEKSFKYIDHRNTFIAGARWQQERSYSEEDMKEAFNNGAFKWRMHSVGKCFEKWFEQFKKK